MSNSNYKICLNLKQRNGRVLLSKFRDLCITSPLAQFLRQSQILILEISNIFLWLKFLPSLSACNAQAGLNLNKI